MPNHLQTQVTFSDGNVTTIAPREPGGCLVSHSDGVSNSCYWVRKCLEQSGKKSVVAADLAGKASDVYSESAYEIGMLIQKWKDNGFPEILPLGSAQEDTVSFSDVLLRKLSDGDGPGNNGPGGGQRSFK